MGDYYRFMLTTEQKQVYQTLLRSMGHRVIPCKAPVADIHAAMKALLMDHPELCFFEGKWSYENGSVYPRYVLSGYAAKQLEAETARIFEELHGTAYPKQVYDWMLEHIAYCPDAANSQNAYGALVERQAVCKGIAKGYQLLMAAANIDCILVEGTLDGRTKHVWNMIFYGDRWQHIDVTMGYPCFWSLTGSVDFSGGYGKKSRELSRSHRIYHPEILPAER